MTIVDSSAPDEPAARTPEPAGTVSRSDDGDGAARIVVNGVLTATVAATAREMLVEACSPKAMPVVLDLQVVLDPADPEALLHLVDVAQSSCWAARCRLTVTASDHDVCEALAAAGIWPETCPP